MSSLSSFEAFKVKDRNTLSQPGTNQTISEAVAENFLNKSATSRSIAEAIVEQQVLKKKVYNRTALKKTLVPPFPNITPKPPKKRRVKPDVEKKIFTSLMYNQIKQQEGQGMDTLVGIGVAEKPPLFFNENGTPNLNSNKSAFKKAILKKYGENNFHFAEVLNSEETATIVDGMPGLFTAPALGMTTFGRYASFFLSRKLVPHFHESNEVHILFDVPSIWGHNLKMSTHAKRDAPKTVLAPLDEDIDDDTKVPSTSQWSSFLTNRADKRKLVEFLGRKILEASKWLEPGQVLIAGGCFHDNETYMITKEKTETLVDFKCNHEEADTRMFAHAAWSRKKCVQLVASDTDILAILLLNHESFTNKQMVIQCSDNKERLDVTKLMKDMEDDGDTELSRVRNSGISSPMVYGTIHALIGSDILCSPRGFGPVWIIKTCLDFATYLFERSTGLQNLHHDSESSKGAYIRFVLALFKKRYSSKIKKRPEEILGPVPNYSEIISELQKETWVHTLESKSMLPSEECLLLRERNFAFQMIIWKQATKPHMNVPKPEQYGWEQTEIGFVLQADSQQNINKQKTIFDAIMRKCACKSSHCQSNRCSCKKNKGFCSSLCDCLNCENTDTAKPYSEVVLEQQPEALDSEEEALTSASEEEDTDSENVENDFDY